jgi:hypothetical protein
MEISTISATSRSLDADLTFRQPGAVMVEPFWHHSTEKARW